MFRIVSNPFVEMTQGVVSNGLGYLAERSEDNKNFAWFWWILTAIITYIGVVLISNYHDKKHKLELEEEQRKLEERRIKALKQ